MQLMTNLDYFFLAKELSEELVGSRLNKAYQTNDKSFRLKFHKEGEKNLVIDLGTRMHLTKYLQNPPDNPSNLVRIIRSKLSNAKVVAIRQVNCDRIIEFEIQGKQLHYLVFEMFGKGALYLLDGDKKIENAFSPTKIEKKSAYLPPVSESMVPKAYESFGKTFEQAVEKIESNYCPHLTLDEQQKPIGFGLASASKDASSSILCFSSLCECLDEYYKQFLDFTEKQVVNKNAEKLGKTLSQLKTEFERQQKLEKEAKQCAEYLSANYEAVEKALSLAKAKKSGEEKQAELTKLGFKLSKGIIEKEIN